MERLTKFLGMIAVAALVAGLGAAGVSAQDKEKAVKDRQDVMKSQGDALKAIKEFIDGKNDIAKAKEGTGTLLVTSKQIPTLFPPGTGIGQVQAKTAAKPEIWSDWQKFLDADKSLQSEVEKLAAAVDAGDKAKIAEQFGSVGKNGCGNCHNTFREKQS
jgi:cytochrome c556